jgi:hypothetical protein
MADELDPRLEARLRTVLRAEADALPFTLRADQVAGRLAERRRARDRRRYAVVAAAAVFAVGAAAFGLSLGRMTGPAAVTPPPSVAPPSLPAPSSSPSLAADCVPVDDPAVLPGLDLVDGTGDLVDPGKVVYDRRSDGATTGDPDGWAVPTLATPMASLADGLRLEQRVACVAEWDIQVANTADVESAIAAGVPPRAETYVVSGSPEGGHDVSIHELPAGDVLLRAEATWYSTQPTAPITVRVYRLSGDAPAEPSPSVAADVELPLPIPYGAPRRDGSGWSFHVPSPGDWGASGSAGRRTATRSRCPTTPG